MTILGTVGIRSWDTGAVVTLGGEIVNYEVDGDTRAVYAVEVPGLDSGLTGLGGKVPIHFAQSEDAFANFILPSYMLKRNDLTPAFERKAWYGVDARVPAPGAEKIVLPDGREGWTEYVHQWRAHPFDIGYELTIHARREQELQAMLMHAMQRYKPPWFVFKVVDSIGDLREYDAGDVTFSNVSELSDIAERMAAYSVSFTVRGEIDIEEDWSQKAMIEPVITYNVYKPDEKG